MRHSEKIDQIATALVLAQGNMGDIIKSSVNPHFGSKFAALPNVVEAIVPALQSQGIAILQSGSTTVETMLIHAASGQWIAGDFELAPNNDPQKACSANTYARRYALLAIVCAAAEDDDGNKASSRKPPQQEQSKPQGPTPLERAAKLGLIPTADRVIFNDYCKERVPGYDKAPNASARMQLVESHLTRLEAQNAKQS